MEYESCFLCPYIVANNPDGIFMFGRDPGVQILIDSSLDRGDGLHDELITISNEMQSDGARTLKMHRKCRTYYIEKKRREAANQKRVAVCPSNPRSSPPKRRSITAGISPGFDIKRVVFSVAAIKIT